ncbi:respiratory nitrate reductase subunit gamma [Mesobacillus subterraneus]|jgi:nitrate reductase gamma subunit|uniref:respiratory nitrate reductase subunit gamma n=1 Tax=Mesobacillus subterraneus TaxID=285983 RepID=UPI00203DD95C|nr:respiratory nitrate reductase subunit gamma [Mesobacillus subterraneus]MCM3663004.1 respiratory nitrate reductase subunit gamma [Mesobacillus subterraneus]MCM3682820.1 respiratory nitrate reductase subunit gamma [Mesobacillus subterraneus]
MEMLQIFLWIVYPYTVAAIVAMGIVWQYDATREEGTTSKASRLLVYVVRGLMAASTATGILIVLSSSIANEPVQLLKWLISLAQLKPDLNLVLNISILSKIHYIIVFLFLLSLAFTREIYYLLKPHLYLKKIFLKLQFDRRG